jgi:hypothetical protein
MIYCGHLPTSLIGGQTSGCIPTPPVDTFIDYIYFDGNHILYGILLTKKKKFLKNTMKNAFIEAIS